MSYVDFEYYQTKYGGSLFENEEDFAPYERKAERREFQGEAKRINESVFVWNRESL